MTHDEVKLLPLTLAAIEEHRARAYMAAYATIPIDKFNQLLDAAENGLRPQLARPIPLPDEETAVVIAARGSGYNVETIKCSKIAMASIRALMAAIASPTGRG